jgi:hypothetical protein
LFTQLSKGCISLCGLDLTLQDGRSINENYGTDLDKLEEGDRVGVLRTGLGDLIFFVNGIAQACVPFPRSGLGSASEGGSDPDTDTVFYILPSKADRKITTGISCTKIQKVTGTFYLSYQQFYHEVPCNKMYFFRKHIKELFTVCLCFFT